MVEDMRVGLICIATGKVYQDYARALHASAKRLMPGAEFILFSDMEHNPGVEYFFPITAKGYPNETLYRYQTMLGAVETLQAFDQLFYCDADMEFVAAVGDIYSEGLTATLHPGFAARSRRGTPETRFVSSAFCTDNTAYFCGGFQGGAAWYYLDAIRIMNNRIVDDARNGITATWHDESHWNRYIADVQFLYKHHNIPLKILTPSYCYPEGYDGGYGWAPEMYPPVLIAKNKKGVRA